VAISLIMVIYEIASSAVASSQRQKQMLCKGLRLYFGSGISISLKKMANQPLIASTIFV